MLIELEKFSYDNEIVRKFAIATVVWGLVGMLVGIIIAIQLFLPSLSFNIPFLTFGRIRPLHTNAVIFAFVGMQFLREFTIRFKGCAKPECSAIC